MGAGHEIAGLLLLESVEPCEVFSELHCDAFSDGGSGCAR